ncbi:hypothetical protein RFI_26481, partial [Reticulomyxa filosa]
MRGLRMEYTLEHFLFFNLEDFSFMILGPFQNDIKNQFLHWDEGKEIYTLKKKLQGDMLKRWKTASRLKFSSLWGSNSTTNVLGGSKSKKKDKLPKKSGGGSSYGHVHSWEKKGRENHHEERRGISSRMILFGTAASGKTTVLHQLELIAKCESLIEKKHNEKKKQQKRKRKQRRDKKRNASSTMIMTTTTTTTTTATTTKKRRKSGELEFNGVPLANEKKSPNQKQQSYRQRSATTSRANVGAMKQLKKSLSVKTVMGNSKDRTANTSVPSLKQSQTSE